MSTSRSRLNRAIQQIAEQSPEIRRILEAEKSRGDQAASAGVGTSDAERDRICCDGSVSDDTNPGTEERDTSEGGSDGLNDDDPADISDMGPGELSGLTDCDTGEPICFDGADFIPPDRWDAPNDPPQIEGYESGIYYCPSQRVSFVWEIECNNCGRYITYDQAAAAIPDCLGGTIEDETRNVAQLSCDEGSTDKWCNPSEEDLLENGGKWPSDGCVNLAIKGGAIVGSKYDPENDGSYSKPRKEMPLCDPNTGESILLRVDTTSTWKTIRRLDGDIDPDTGYGYLWDTASGKKIRQISPSEFRDDTV